MNEHGRCQDRLPLYAAGRLGPLEIADLEEHLQVCAECRADLDLWRAVAVEVNAADAEIEAWPGLVERAEARIHARSSLRGAFLRAFSLLRAQAYLVRRELWPAAAILMGIGVVVSYLLGKMEVIRFIAPLIAAASLATIYGPEHDPASELTLATPTSPWKVLLARLTLVHAYNLLLALVASSFLLAFLPPGLLGGLILGWLGPMTFLSALALLLSLWIGSSTSIAITYTLWLVQYPRYELALDPPTLTTWQPTLEAYRQFWGDPILLIGLSAVLLLAVLSTVRGSLPRRIQHQI